VERAHNQPPAAMPPVFIADRVREMSMPWPYFAAQ
jgi:hypothetical protein